MLLTPARETRGTGRRGSAGRGGRHAPLIAAALPRWPPPRGPASSRGVARTRTAAWVCARGAQPPSFFAMRSRRQHVQRITTLCKRELTHMTCATFRELFRISLEEVFFSWTHLRGHHFKNIIRHGYLLVSLCRVFPLLFRSSDGFSFSFRCGRPSANISAKATAQQTLQGSCTEFMGVCYLNIVESDVDTICSFQ